MDLWQTLTGWATGNSGDSSPSDEQRMANPLENPTIPISADPEEFWAFFRQLAGNGLVQLPPVTIGRALSVPAVSDAVGFLSRTLASLPLHVFREKDGETDKVDGDIGMLLNEAPNPEWSSFAWREYSWQQVFTGGRAMTWIERAGLRPVAMWPMDPSHTTIARVDGRKVYRFEGREYSPADVIDLPWMLRTDQIGSFGPIALHKDTIALAIAMNDFAATFFAGGGVPPLALEGPLPQGTGAFKRAAADINRAVELAKAAGSPFFGMPPGHALKPIGIDPEKGQMTAARLFQIQEIARIYGLPPVFLQDLSRGTFSNTEQQDLQLVKHLIAHWVKKSEQEFNLKLFGQRRRSRRVKHNLDGLQRGSFKERIEGLARGITTMQLLPDEARALENRPPLPDDLGARPYIQGATVPADQQAELIGKRGWPKSDKEGDEGDDDAGNKTDD